MIVVSNTTPLRYLVEVDAVHILPALFKSITTTPAVIDELRRPHFPEKVRLWSQQLPDWLIIERPQLSLPLSPTLHPGEAEAIALAKEKSAFRLLMDDKSGIEIARQLSLPVLRTLALVAVAGEEKLIDANATIQRLASETKFRATPALFNRYLAREREIREAVAVQLHDIAAERLRTENGPKHDRDPER